MRRKRTKLIHEGKYAAEVPVELIEDDTAWSPYLTPEHVRKLDAVRLALRRGDIAEAARYGRVFELAPIAGLTLSPVRRSTPRRDSHAPAPVLYARHGQGRGHREGRRRA